MAKADNPWIYVERNLPDFGIPVQVKRENCSIDSDTLIVTGPNSMAFRKVHFEGKDFVSCWRNIE